MNELEQAVEDYARAFGMPPYPFGVKDDKYLRELRAAVERGAPIPPDFDWYPDLPDGAVA